MYKKGDVVTCRETGKCLGIVAWREFNQPTVTWRIWCDLHRAGTADNGLYPSQIRAK